MADYVPMGWLDTIVAVNWGTSEDVVWGFSVSAGVAPPPGEVHTVNTCTTAQAHSALGGSEVFTTPVGAVAMPNFTVPMAGFVTVDQAKALLKSAYLVSTLVGRYGSISGFYAATWTCVFGIGAYVKAYPHLASAAAALVGSMSRSFVVTQPYSSARLTASGALPVSNFLNQAPGTVI